MDISRINLNKLRCDLFSCRILAQQRCLFKAVEWVDSLAKALPEDGEEKIIAKLDKESNDETTFEADYEHAKSCFQLHEYDRAAFLIRNHLDDDKSRFLHYFSKYKAAEKKRIDLMNEVEIALPIQSRAKYVELRDSIERSMRLREPDGCLLYIYGLILAKFRLHKRAIKELERAINLSPNNWSAWYFLGTLIDSRDELDALDLPNHSFKIFFYYKARSDLEIDPKEPWTMVGARETRNFIDKYFKNTTFIKVLNARSLAYVQNDFEAAIKLFSEIRRDHPLHIDFMDVYSNLLYMKKDKTALAKLACEIERVDPWTPEANNCIGNSFSARDQHSKAILYFTRALRLNPDNLHSWSLIGHEYLAMKNYDKAHQAYQNALSTNKRDIRAWFGLGKTFESIMSNPTNQAPNYERCLYYYSQIGKYKPRHELMYKAMGNLFERMEQPDMAIICYKQAGKSCWLRLARLYESKGLNSEAEEIQAQINADDGDVDCDEIDD